MYKAALSTRIRDNRQTLQRKRRKRRCIRRYASASAHTSTCDIVGIAGGDLEGKIPLQKSEGAQGGTALANFVRSNIEKLSEDIHSTNFQFVVIHGKIYENMHLPFLIYRMNIFGILLFFDVV
jgi:hypothetical protein